MFNIFLLFMRYRLITNGLSDGLMNPSKLGSLKRELLFAFLPTLESRRPKAVRISIEFPSQQMQQTLVSVLDADRLKSLPFRLWRFFGWHDFHTNRRLACLRSSSTLPSTRQLEEVLENPNQWPASYATLIAKLYIPDTTKGHRILCRFAMTPSKSTLCINVLHPFGPSGYLLAPTPTEGISLCFRV